MLNSPATQPAPSPDVFSPDLLTPAAALVRRLITLETIARVQAMGLSGEGISDAMMSKVNALINSCEAKTLVGAIRIAGGRPKEFELYVAEM